MRLFLDSDAASLQTTPIFTYSEGRTNQRGSMTAGPLASLIINFIGSPTRDKSPTYATATPSITTMAIYMYLEEYTTWLGNLTTSISTTWKIINGLRSSKNPPGKWRRRLSSSTITKTRVTRGWVLRRRLSFKLSASAWIKFKAPPFQAKIIFH